MGAGINTYCMIVAYCLTPPCYSGVVYLRIPLLVIMLLHQSTATVLPLAIVNIFYAELTLLFGLPMFLLRHHICDARH